MAQELHKYRLSEYRLKRSYLDGFLEVTGNQLVCDGVSGRHLFVSCPIDGVYEEAAWGRCTFHAEFDEETVMTVYAYASDERDIEDFFYNKEISIQDKRIFLEKNGAVRKVNHSDFLLHELKGRFLYLMIDVMGTFSGVISDILVYNKSDILLDSFPEVFRESGDFFAKYLSIFTSKAIDFQTDINHADEILDVDTAPAELLPVFAGWMGLDLSGDFLPQDRLRLLLKEAYKLNKMKGTKAALERLTQIILGESAIVLEKNVFRDHTQIEDKEIYASLYGDKPYDITMLIKTYVPESKKSQLVFLLNQFRPVRCRLKFHFLDGSGEIDSHSYLDVNARVYDYEAATLDERKQTDGMLLLTE